MITQSNAMSRSITDTPREVKPPVVPLDWIKLDRYCELTGDTPGAVHARRRKRQWTNGVQCIVGPDGNLWINPAAFNAWVRGEKAPEPT
jgi:hypothetical protein